MDFAKRLKHNALKHKSAFYGIIENYSVVEDETNVANWSDLSNEEELNENDEEEISLSFDENDDEINEKDNQAFQKEIIHSYFSTAKDLITTSTPILNEKLTNEMLHSPLIKSQDDITPCLRRTKKRVETKKTFPSQTNNILNMVREKNMQNNNKNLENIINSDEDFVILSDDINDDDDENMIPLANIFNQSINQINLNNEYKSQIKQADRFRLRNILNSQSTQNVVPTPQKKDKTNPMIIVDDSVDGNLTTVVPDTQLQQLSSQPIKQLLGNELKRTNHDRIETNDLSLNINDTIYEQRNKKFKSNYDQVTNIQTENETSSNRTTYNYKIETTNNGGGFFCLPTQPSQSNEVIKKDSQSSGTNNIKKQETSTPQKSTDSKYKIKNLLEVSIIHFDPNFNKILTHKKNNQVIINDTEMHETNTSNSIKKTKITTSQVFSTQVVNETKVSSQLNTNSITNVSFLRSSISKIPIESPLILKKVANKQKNMNKATDLSGKDKIESKKIKLKKPADISISSSDDSFRKNKSKYDQSIKKTLNSHADRSAQLLKGSFSNKKCDISSSTLSSEDDDDEEIPMSVLVSNKNDSKKIHISKLNEKENSLHSKTRIDSLINSSVNKINSKIIDTIHCTAKEKKNSNNNNFNISVSDLSDDHTSFIKNRKEINDTSKRKSYTATNRVNSPVIAKQMANDDKNSKFSYKKIENMSISDFSDQHNNSIKNNKKEITKVSKLQFSISSSSSSDDEIPIKILIKKDESKYKANSSTSQKQTKMDSPIKNTVKKKNIESSILINGTVDSRAKNFDNTNIDISMDDSSDSILKKSNKKQIKLIKNLSFSDDEIKNSINKDESKYKANSSTSQKQTKMDSPIKSTTVNKENSKKIENSILTNDISMDDSSDAILNKLNKKKIKLIKSLSFDEETLSSKPKITEKSTEKIDCSINQKKTNTESSHITSCPIKENTISNKSIRDSFNNSSMKSIKNTEKEYITLSSDDEKETLLNKPKITDKISNKKIDLSKNSKNNEPINSKKYIQSSILINGTLDFRDKFPNNTKINKSMDNNNSLIHKKVTSTHVSLKTKYENSKELIKDNKNEEPSVTCDNNNNSSFENVLNNNKDKFQNNEIINKKPVKDPIIIKTSLNKKLKIMNDSKAMPPPKTSSSTTSTQEGLYYNGIFIPVVHENKSEPKIRIKLNNSSNRSANSINNGSINTSRSERFDLKKLLSDSFNNKSKN